MKTFFLFLAFFALALMAQAKNTTIPQDTSLIDAVRSNYSTVYRDKTTGWYIVEKNNQWGYLDETGEVVVEPKYDNACGFHEGLASVRRNGKWGWINQRGEEVIKPLYENAGKFSNGIASAEFGGKWGWINKTGKIVIGFEYDWVMSFRNDGAAAVKKSNKWGWINMQGEVVIPFEFDKVDGYEEGLVRVTKGTNTYYINKFGKCVEDCYHENDNNTASR